MQVTTLINTPVLFELAQPAHHLTVAHLSDVDHPVNIKALSGKREGMACMINGVIYKASGADPSDVWEQVTPTNVYIPPLNFTVESNDPIVLSTDAASPSYITGLVLDEASSDDFEVLAGGWIKNNSGRTINLRGSVTYQLAAGSGGAGKLHLWSETNNAGVIVTNPNSLRTEEISNNATSSGTKSSKVNLLADGSAVRWAAYNAGAGTLTFAQPSDIVNGSDAVTGSSFYFSLQEIV